MEDALVARVSVVVAMGAVGVTDADGSDGIKLASGSEFIGVTIN